MYITENQNLGESVLFMLSARSSLAEMVEDSNHDNANIMIDFLMNEATDFEIIALLVEGKLPEEKYNEAYEIALFSHLKEQVLANHETISEMIGQKSFSDFMTKVDSVYPHVSTAGPMIEFFAIQDPQIAGAILLSEGPAANLAKALSKKAAAKTGEGGMGLKDVGGGGKAIAGRPGPGSTTDPDAITAFKGPTGTSSPGAIAQTKQYVDTGPKPAGFDPKIIKDTEPGLIAQIKSGLSSAADAVSGFAKTPAGLAVGGAAIAALLAYGAAKTYKRFFSKAAGACRGMGGAAKSDCMNKYRGRAYMAQAGDLQRGMASCSKAKNPASCKSAVGGKIERLKAKARQIAG